MSDECPHRFSTSHEDGLTCERCGQRLCTFCAGVGGHLDGCPEAIQQSNESPPVD